MSLLVSKSPWENVRMNFVHGLQKTWWNKDYIMVVVDQFPKMALFFPCSKSFYAIPIIDLYLWEIV